MSERYTSGNRHANAAGGGRAGSERMGAFGRIGSIRSGQELKELLRSIDHRGYPAYKDTRGRWSYGNYFFCIDHVQGDPFASPSSVSLIVPGEHAAFPKEAWEEEHRRVAFQDYLLRQFCALLSKQERGNAGSGKSGLLFSSRPGQEILERTACHVSPRTGTVTLRFEIGFPANGRSINAGALIRILEGFVPEAVKKCLTWKAQDHPGLQKVLELADDQQSIRIQLQERGLCAFVADGSILPRMSGVSQLPMRGAVPFVSPESMAVTLRLPHAGEMRGMGIRRGVTLIVGGGYHGKSTLLQALERGVYNHIRGDGREYVITTDTAVKVRAEDGRCITGTDISPFIHDLPNRKDTVSFFTEDASGSTSQAANVVEAVEAGTHCLLIDEDTSATNFMVRDELMARVVSREMEPITPFIAKIRGLYEQAGISTILVAGSSGAFFHVADTIVQMDHYRPVEITERAKTEAAGERQVPQDDWQTPHFDRKPGANSALLRENRLKLKVLSEDAFLIARDEVDLRGVEQITDREQTAALAYSLKYLQLHILDGRQTFQEAVDRLTRVIREKGLEELFDGGCVGNGLAQVRRQEVFAMLSRYRGLKLP